MSSVYSALGPLYEAVGLRFGTDTAFRALVGATDTDSRVYDETEIPETAAPDDNPRDRYVVFTGQDEGEQNWFGRSGHSGIVTLRLTAPSKTVLYQLYNEALRLFHRTTLTLADHELLVGRFATRAPDFPDGALRQLPCVYRASTRSGVAA